MTAFRVIGTTTFLIALVFGFGWLINWIIRKIEARRAR